MRDLEEDFGFRIGGGNQAYHFDTLPGEVKSIQDVKPGDLVFMSGIYNTSRRKFRQKIFSFFYNLNKRFKHKINGLQ